MARINICDKCKNEIKDNFFFEIFNSFANLRRGIDLKIMLCNKCEGQFIKDFNKILIKHNIIKKEDSTSFKKDKNYEEK